MFDEQDRAYFAHRAEKESVLASEAANPAIRKIHADMAAEYQRRSLGGEPQYVTRDIPNKTMREDDA